MRNNPVAVVTGSSSGIGAAIARRLADDGARVIVNSARSAQAGRDFAKSLPDAIYVQADIARETEAKALIDAAIDTFGRLDILINNAGTTRVIPHRDLRAVTAQVWREIIDVNVIGTWQVSAAAIPHLEASGAGAIVNVSSVAGSRPAGSSIPYAVSKAAIEHMTRLLANVVGPAVRVNAIAPGLIQTPWTQGFDDVAEMVRQKTPLRRVGLPADVADAVIGLLRSEYVTGQVLLVDGGAHLI